jgi:transposase
MPETGYRSRGSGRPSTRSPSRRPYRLDRETLRATLIDLRSAPRARCAFGERIRARRGGQVAAVAVARKVAVIAWQLLTKGEDYAFGRPSLTRAKLRAAERKAGAPRLPNRHRGQRISATAAERQAERELAERGEKAYRRLAADWSASRPPKEKAGAGATSGRAS